jgi:transcriptional regulator with XRE-family HTH domain
LTSEHPVRIWREHRGLTGSALAVKAGVPTSYLCEIEGRRKPDSVSAYRRLATALGVTLDDLVPADEAA